MQKQFKELFDLCPQMRKYEVFDNFLAAVACAISIVSDSEHFIKRLEKYNKIEEQLGEKAMLKIADIVDLLHKEIDENPRDILGKLYMTLDMGNDALGQVFTPQSIANLIAATTWNDEITEKKIQEKGCITLYEPTCGSGVNVISFVNLMKQKGYNPQEQLIVYCQDLDIKAVYMCYIQLKLLKIQAVVSWGNTITNEIYEEWK